MMLDADRDAESSAQRRIARKYRMLGYDVIEHPTSDGLPDFMLGAAPDIVARSVSDNVVIKVKRHGSLKGSNDLVNIADRISKHLDWRFELVVLGDSEAERSKRADISLERAFGRVDAAIGAGLLDMAYVYAVEMLVAIGRSLAEKSGVKTADKTGGKLFDELGFKGILPEDMLEASLSALSTRNSIVHAHEEAMEVSEEDVKGLLRLCDRMHQLA